MACSTTELYYVENDTGPDLDCTYTGVDITSYSFELHIAYEIPKVIVGTIVDAGTGRFKFSYSAGDLQAGKFAAEIQVTDDAGQIITFQGLKFVIEPEIA